MPNGRQFLPFISSLMEKPERPTRTRRGEASPDIVEALAENLSLEPLFAPEPENAPEPSRGLLGPTSLQSPETTTKRRFQELMAGLELEQEGSLFGTPLPLEAPLVGGIAVGPLGPIRPRIPGEFLKVRALAEDLFKKLKLPEGIKVFLGGGKARGFGRFKSDPLPAEQADVDLILGIPPEAMKELRRRFFPQIKDQLESMSRIMKTPPGVPPNLTIKEKVDLGLFDGTFLTVLMNDLRFAAAGKAGGAIRTPRIGRAELDIIPTKIENVGKGMVGFDPVVELPIRRLRKGR